MGGKPSKPPPPLIAEPETAQAPRPLSEDDKYFAELEREAKERKAAEAEAKAKANEEEKAAKAAAREEGERNATRLGELLNTPESVAALEEWVRGAQQYCVCYFSWADQEAITRKRMRSPHYRLERIGTGWSLSSCNDDRGDGRKQLVGNASRVIGKPVHDPTASSARRKLGFLQTDFGYVPPPPPHNPNALQWWCGQCEAVFEGPNLCNSNTPSMNCRLHHSDFYFQKEPSQVQEKSWHLRDAYGKVPIWYHVGEMLDGEWYRRDDCLKSYDGDEAKAVAMANLALG